MSQEIVQKLRLVTDNCCVCGIVFGLPDFVLARKKQTGEEFYCPNGHSLSYTGSENSRLRK